MRKLWPNTKTLTETEKEEYSNLIEELAQKIAETATDLQKAINQETLRASGAEEAIRLYINGLFDSTIELLKAEHIESTDITTEELTADIIRVAVELSAQSVTAQMGNILELVANNIRADSVTADEVTATTIRANKAEIDEYDITDLHSDNGTIANLASDTATIKQATIASADIDDATIDTLKANEAKILEAEINEFKGRHIYNEFITHNEKFNVQSLSDDSIGADGDYWIVVPKFVNGIYNIIATTNTDAEEGEVLWSMEILNSSRNLCFKWSTNKVNPWLQDVDIIEDETDHKEFIQIHAKTYGQAVYLWHQSDSFDTTTPLSIYSTKQYDGKNFVFNRDAGTWLNNSTFAGEFHADKMLIDEVEFDSVYILKNIYLTTQYDQYGATVSTTRGETGQYIRNTKDEYDNKGVQWETPADEVNYENKLIRADAVANYNGEIVVEDEDGETHSDYNLIHLGNGTEVHGGITIDTFIENPHLYIGKEVNLKPDYLEDDALVLFTEVIEDSEYTPNVFYRKRTIDLEETYYKLIPRSEMEDSKPVIYDQATDTIKTSDTLDIDEFRANKITVEDLTVSGTAHIENTEEETVQGDFVTVRVNTSSGLATGEYAGLLVNNFKEDEICAIVVDKDGTARVGHATGEDTVYDDLYFKDDKYYTDEELTEEVEPEGMLLSWTDKTESDGVTHWTDAKWRKLNFDSTQAFLTREESVDMNDQGLIKWNADTNKSDTIAVPDKSEQILVSKVTEDDEGNSTLEYEWIDKLPGTFVFETMEEYENYDGNIPVGSQIIIEEDKNYLTGDDIHE